MILAALLLVALSPPPGAPEPVTTLRAALARAREASPRVLAGRARAEAAERAARVAGRLPSASLDLHSENWRRGPGFSATSDVDLFAVAEQPLELSGVRGARVRTAAAESAEARAARLALEREVQVETARAWVRAAHGDELVVDLEAQAGRLGEIVRMLRRRVEEGVMPEADLMKFRAEETRARIHLLRARLERDAARRSLEALLAAPIAGAPLAQPELPPLPEGDADTLAAAALESQPAVLGAAARLRKAEGSWSEERAKGRPDAALLGGYKRTGGFDTAVFGLVLSAPFFDRNGRARALAEGEARAAALTLEATRSEQRAALTALLVGARALAERATGLRAELVEPTDVVRQAAATAFHEGTSAALALVDAERTHAEARREALELAADAAAAAVEARLALGLEALP